MNVKDRPKDVYGNPIQPGCLYQIELKKGCVFSRRNVRVYYTAQNILMAEDISKTPGQDDRFAAVANIASTTTWTQIDQDFVPVEPPSRDVPSVADRLGEIERRVFDQRAELQRLEVLACRTLGCEVRDGSYLSDVAFDFIYNGVSFERTNLAYEQWLSEAAERS
jgi:hypothetical protein